MKLTHLPTEVLLAELGRRLDAVPAIGAEWAHPTLLKVARVCNVRVVDLTGASARRTGALAEATHFAMAALYVLCPRHTVQAIGAIFSRGHEVVLHAVKKTMRLCDQKPEIAAAWVSVVGEDNRHARFRTMPRVISRWKTNPAHSPRNATPRA